MLLLLTLVQVVQLLHSSARTLKQLNAAAPFFTQVVALNGVKVSNMQLTSQSCVAAAAAAALSSIGGGAEWRQGVQHAAHFSKLCCCCCCCCAFFHRWWR
jgi:hypothetical protein